MKTETITDFFENQGLILYPEINENFQDINYDNVVSHFEEKGIIIFRNFNFEPENILNFTDKFTNRYAADAPRRENFYGKKNINSVDIGNHEMPLHSEASYSPSWPEIIWFFCVTPPSDGGATTLCDGIKLWKSLSLEAKNFFLSNPIRFELEFPVVKKISGKGKKLWQLNSLGSSEGVIDWDEGIFSVNQIRFAVNESRYQNELTFANHLMIIFSNEPQIKKMTTIHGEKIPDEIDKEIREKSSNITYDIKWKPNDLVMLDNKRFMHGRRSYKKGSLRKIINIQTLQANFSYGSTTRKKIIK